MLDGWIGWIIYEKLETVDKKLDTMMLSIDRKLPIKDHIWVSSPLTTDCWLHGSWQTLP